MRNLSAAICFIVLFIAGCTKYEVVFDQQPSDSFELPLILRMNDTNCAFDANSGVLKFSVDEETLSDFQPRIEFQSHSDVYLEGEELLNGESNQLGTLELHKRYNLTFLTEGKEYELHLEFTNAPIIQVITLDEIPNEPKVLGRLLVHSPSPNTPPTDTFVGIEQRGRSSLNLAKRSYGFETLSAKNLDSQIPISLLEIPTNDHWVLDAQFTDRARVRSKVTFDLWEELGHRSLASEYAELYINNTFKGIYKLGEYYSPTQLEAGPGHVLIKGNDNTSVTKFLQMHNHAPIGANWEAWEQVYPHPSTQTNWTAFETMSRTIVEHSDADFAEAIPSQLDLDQLIDYYLLISLCYGYDNAGKNWLFYQQTSSEPFEVLLWDLNATWGFAQDGAHLPSDLKIYNNLFTSLIQSNPDNFRSRVKDRWFELRQQLFSEATLMSRVETNIHQLNSYNAYEKENALWGSDIESTVERNYIHNWLMDRLVHLDGFFEEMPG